MSLRVPRDFCYNQNHKVLEAMWVGNIGPAFGPASCKISRDATVVGKGLSLAELRVKGRLMSESLTPMMRQYMEAKRLCPDALLLFRMGDFYELFFEDARIAARTLGLALTSREKGPDAPPMAGFPYHQLDTYLARLIAAGFRVAICEQVEDPREAKGLVRREITRIVSPGTVTEELLLEPRQSNYLAAVWPEDPAGLAWVELTTGRFTPGWSHGNRLQTN